MYFCVSGDFRRSEGSLLTGALSSQIFGDLSAAAVQGQGSSIVPLRAQPTFFPLNFQNFYSKCHGLSAPFIFPKSQTSICRAVERPDTKEIQKKSKKNHGETSCDVSVCVCICHDGLSTFWC